MDWGDDLLGHPFSTTSVSSFVLLPFSAFPVWGNCLSSGEDPLAGDQNDHDMDSIAGVLKLYFRGLEHPLFPKDIFHDLMTCVSKYNPNFLPVATGKKFPLAFCSHQLVGNIFLFLCKILLAILMPSFSLGVGGSET